MNNWQRSLVTKLESARKHWRRTFDEIATEHVEPVNDEFSEFATKNGFTCTSPASEAGTYFYKFALTENGYAIIAFRLAGMDTVEVVTEVRVPGPDEVAPLKTTTPLSDANRSWATQQFQHALDHFANAFSAASAEAAEKLVAAS